METRAKSMKVEMVTLTRLKSGALKREAAGDEKKRICVLPLYLFFVLFFILASCYTASAGYYGDGCPFDNWYNGTLHGDIYFHTKGHYGPAGATLNETFENVPDGRKIVRLYTAVWLGSPSAGRVTTFDISVNGHTDTYHFTDTRSGCFDPPQCDLVDEPEECNADYTGCGVVTISYNASPHIVTGTNNIIVSTEEQLYQISLLVIYENESMPEIQYWVKEGQEYPGEGKPDDNYTMYFNETVNTGRIYTGSIESVKFWSLGYPHGPGNKEWPELNGNYVDECDYVYSYDAGGSVYEGIPRGKEYEVFYRWDSIPPDYINSPSNRFYYPKLGNDRMEAPVLMLVYSEPSELNVTDISPESLCVDYYNTIDATVVNVGGTARLFNATLYVNGEMVDVKPVSNLGEGESRTVKFLWKPGAAGSYVLTVTADVENVIKESDKTNNTKIEEVEVKIASPPEWQSQSSSVTQIPAGGAIELSAQGRADLGLDLAFLATNENGIWVNHTTNYGYSPLDLNSYCNYSLSHTAEAHWKGQTVDNLSVIGDDIKIYRMLGENNSALNQPAYADSYYYYPPENANDGNSGSSWVSGEPFDGTGWWYVDLGAVRDLQQIKIDFHDPWGGMPYKYTVDISTNAADWTTKIERSVGKDETFENIGWSCRYIRVNILAALGSNPYVAIAEFEAYGPGDYKPCGTLTSTTVASTDHPIVAVTPGWSSTEPVGTYVSVNVSVDNGATWKLAVNGEELTWDYDTLNNTKLRYKVFLATTNVSETPVLHDITLNYTTRDPIEGTWLWSNFTWHNASITDKTVGWQICYADTVGKTNCTDVMTFKVGASALPSITEQWNMTFGGAGNDYGYSVQQTTDGGYVIAGHTESYGAGDADIWLIKTDSNGAKEWSRTFGGAEADLLDRGSVRQTSDGGYIITGYTHSYGAGDADVWLIKADSDGNEEWNRTFGGEGLDWGHSVQQTSDGGYILAGRRAYAGARADVWLIKTNSNGVEEWDNTFGAEACEYAASVQQTTDSGYIITGRTNSYGAGTVDVWLIKTNSNGVEEWNRTFGGLYYDYGYSVQQTADGGYIIAGSTNNRQDFWLIKTDSEGLEEWNSIFGGPAKDEGYSVQQTTDGGYILAGYTESFGSGSGDVWLIRTDKNGNEKWNMTFGGVDLDEGCSVQQTADSGYIVTGYTHSFGAGGSDVWLIKLLPSLVWQYEGLNKPIDAERLANNNTLITTFGNHSVLEVTPDKQIVWRYGDGTAGSGVNQLNCPADAERLANNNTLITDRGNNRVIEVDRNKTTVWEMTTGLNNPMDAERLSNGNTLIADRLNNRVIEVNQAKEIVWEYGISNPFDVERLPNNNTLIVEYTNHRVIEVNSTKEVVWQYGTGTAGSGANELNYPEDAERLLNNHTLITDSLNHRVIEISQSKEIVWQYGTGTPGSGVNELNYPEDAERLYNNNTLITDANNSRIIELVTIPPPAPKLVSFAPLSPVYDCEGAVRTFSLTVDQVVNVSWLINGLIVQENTSVLEASEARYVNTSAKLGIWNVSAIASNPNGATTKKWDWKVVTSEGPDLTVSMLNAYHNNTGESPWFNLSNEVDVTIENNGTATEPFNVCLYADDEFIAEKTVSGLGIGRSTTVQFKWTPVGADCFNWTPDGGEWYQPVCCEFNLSAHDYHLKAVVDSGNEIAEINETNNDLTTVETVCYNGYMADEPLEISAHGKLHGALLFTTGDGTYGGLYSRNDHRNTTYEITIPENARVELARLNVYYTWHYEKESCPAMEVSITYDGNTYPLPLNRSYNDIKCQCPGAMWVFPWGNYVYDLTEHIQGTGTYTVTVRRAIPPYHNPSFCIAAPGIVVLYEDKTKPLIEYWIAEGADVLIGGRRADGGYLSLEECITNATFPGNIDRSKVNNATLGVVSPWAGKAWTPGQTNYVYFNGIVLGQGVYHGYSEIYNETINGISMDVGRCPEGKLPDAQVGATVFDVTSYLNESVNWVGQGDDGDNMMPCNAFLVVEYKKEIPPTPFLIYGKVNYDTGSPVLNPTVTITNLNTGEVFTVETKPTSNEFQVLSSSINVSAGAILRVCVSNTVTTEFDHTVTQEEMNNGGFKQNVIIETALLPFDTRPGTYPSISGVHKGNITLKHNVTVSQMYTYPCEGTGGHSKFVELSNDTFYINGTWNGYLGDYHNITFPQQFTLLVNHTYNYTIKTGSYPQIHHHTDELEVDAGTIRCTVFIDANGKRYNDWIPAIRLFP